MHRRHFIETATAATALTTLTQASQGISSSSIEPVIVGVMGMSRGRDLAVDLVKQEGVEVRYVCDVDMQRAESAAKVVEDSGGRSLPIQDFRRILDDKEVHALICAAPNHWHGPATIIGCKAGKHVYVEKPACHNAQEGEWMIAAANQYGRCVQMGTQRRSNAGYMRAMEQLQAGVIGKVYLSRAFYNSKRGSIGVRSDGNAPANLNFDLWQGPAPRKAYRENVVHYNWHWFWHWGNGELGNNGVHLVDLCRWGLGVDFPVRTVSSGGRYRYQDDQETPDTQCVAWEFEGGKQITYEGLSCAKHPGGPFVSFYGYDGYMEIDGDGGYRIFDPNDKLRETVAATGGGQREHIANFIEAIRENDASRLRQPILSAHQSTLLCHLGNIAHRTGRAIETDPKSGRLLDESLASEYWGRDYDSAWDAQIRSL
jgi:predicted dehydrogenase